MARKPKKKTSNDGWNDIDTGEEEFFTLEDFEEEDNDQEDFEELEIEEEEEEDIDEGNEEEEEDEDDPRLQKLFSENEQLKKEFQRIQEAKKKYQEKYKKSTKELTENKKTTRQKQLEQLEAEKERWKKTWTKAKEANDPEQELEAWEAYTNATQRATLLKLQEEIEPEEEDTEEEEEDLEEEEEQQAVNPNIPKKAQKWLSKNKWWGKNKKKTRWAMTISDDLVEEGYDLNDDEHYELLEERLAELTGEEEETRKSKPKKKSKEAPMTPGTGKRSSRRRGNKIRLSKGEIEWAEKLGLTPQQYAAQKLNEQQNKDGTWTNINFGESSKFSHMTRRR